MQVRDFFKSLGMPYSMHRCRHTFGTRLYAQTKDVLIVQDLMRHENANTTRGYVQTTRVEAVAALDRLGRSLRGPSPTRRRKPATPSSDTRRAG
jgi:integrase